MNRIVLHPRVDADGILKLAVPLGAAAADREVQVTIETGEQKARPNSMQEEWRQFVLETAGAWKGDLERPEQGEYEKRDELP
jgi:hypothetical protein